MKVPEGVSALPAGELCLPLRNSMDNGLYQITQIDREMGKIVRNYYGMNTRHLDSK